MAINSSDYALIIGINDYPRFDFPLKGARDDAEDFAKWVNDTETGGGVPLENTVVLLSKIVDKDLARPVHEEIDDKLYGLINKALENQETTTPRRFYFYFSGHGLGLSSEEVGLCLPFWSSDTSAAAALKMSGYINYIKSWGIFPEIFFFMDCCRVSLQAAGGYDPTLTLTKPDKGAADSRHLAAFASTYTNAAFEAAVKGAQDKIEIRGFFTRSLLEALNGAAARFQGGVPLDKLLLYLDGRVSQLAAESGKVQKASYMPTFNLSDMPNIILGSALPPEKLATKDILEAFSMISFKVNKSSKARDVEISIRNSDFEEIYRGFDVFSKDLPEGKYLLHFQKGDQAKDLVIEHETPGTEIAAPELAHYSSILLQDAASSHEYYTDKAVKWSHEMTDKLAINAQNESGLFLFARFPNGESAQDFDLFKEMDLLDENMQVVHDFPPGTYQEDRQAGWFAFSGHCGKGQYYLRYDCHPARIIPIYCFPNWQTQVFVTLKDKSPIFETLRILTARIDEGFAPNDSATITDTTFEYLKNIDLELPPSLVENLLYRKFETPMLGILGAYLVLQRSIKELLPKMPLILDNLNILLKSPESPDLKALSALYAPEKSVNISFGHPPMIAFGAEGVIHLENEGKVNILPNSAFENMTTSRKNDLLLTSWCEDKHQKIALESWVADALLQSILYARRNHIALDTRMLARQIAVPVNKVETALDYLVQNPSVMADSWVTKQHSAEVATIQSDLIHLQKHKKMPVLNEPIKVVTVFAPDTFGLLKELRENCLGLLQDKGIIAHWDTEQMLTGSTRQKVIQQKIEEADVFIGLISSAYLGQDSESYRMHQMGLDSGKWFLPIIAKTGFYDLNPEINEANPLPLNEAVVKPLDQWGNRNEAWEQITRKIMAIVQEIRH